MSVMDIGKPSFRCRPAPQCRAGPNNELGFLSGMPFYRKVLSMHLLNRKPYCVVYKGKTFMEACRSTCWKNAILVGVTVKDVLFDSGEEGDAIKSGGAAAARGGDDIVGIAPSPDYSKLLYRDRISKYERVLTQSSCVSVVLSHNGLWKLSEMTTFSFF